MNVSICDVSVYIPTYNETLHIERAEEDSAALLAYLLEPDLKIDERQSFTYHRKQ